MTIDDDTGVEPLEEEHEQGHYASLVHLLLAAVTAQSVENWEGVGPDVDKSG